LNYDRFALARIRFEHPHAYRDWLIVGPKEVPGFWLLKSVLRLGDKDAGTTNFELIVHETQFERL
jgi:hypothetical protein